MSKPVKFAIGPIECSGPNMTTARESAIESAGRVLGQIDRARPSIVAWRGRVCLVYPIIVGNGMEWGYVNPRTVAEYSADAGRDMIGTTSAYATRADAISSAMSHMMQIDELGIPADADFPACLNTRDADNLRTLRRYRAEDARKSA